MAVSLGWGESCGAMRLTACQALWNFGFVKILDFESVASLEQWRMEEPGELHDDRAYAAVASPTLPCRIALGGGKSRSQSRAPEPRSFLCIRSHGHATLVGADALW